jgi:dephospho-CoA kinase
LALGCDIIDADKIAHEVLDREHQEIAKLFGFSLIVNAKVDRKALGKIIFADRHKRKQLEALLHPLIYDEILEKSKELDKKKRCYFVDIPLFFENKRYAIDKVLLVYIPLELQIKRLIQRDNSTEEEAQKRIDTQLPIGEKIANSDYLIENTATLTDLEEKCMRMKAKILEDMMKE